MNGRMLLLASLFWALETAADDAEWPGSGDDPAGTAAGSAISGEIVEAFEFDVYLDEQRIGSHAFTIRESSHGERVVHSEADFAVHFLFFTAFEYEHRNSERWRDGCLSALSARTNRNGEAIAVDGEKTERGFVVATGDGETVLPHCVMSFAYWDTAFLEQPRLLNPQTGQFVPVDVERQDAGTESDGPVTYLIRSRDLEIRVQYSADHEWIGLEAPAKGGRVLRYVLS